MELDFFYAKHKHRMWKMHLKAYLLGISDFDENRITSSANCELGKWMNSAEGLKFKNLPEFDELIETHEKVHQIVRDIPELVKKNNVVDANLKYKQLESGSAKLISILEKFEKSQQLTALNKTNYEVY